MEQLGWHKLPPVRRRKGRAWTSDEARRFLESARTDRDPLYAAYVLILVLGLRKGEVLGLTEDDVDLAAGELSIGWQLQRVGGQLLHRETKMQTSDARLPLPDICAAALGLRQAAKKHDRDQAGIAWRGTALLFATPLVDLDVLPRVIMQVLRHAEISVTMEIYSQASSDATRDALKRLGESLR